MVEDDIRNWTDCTIRGIYTDDLVMESNTIGNYHYISMPGEYMHIASSTATNDTWYGTYTWYIDNTCVDSFNKYVDVRNIVNESDINVAWNMSPKIEPDIEKIDAENLQLNEFLDSFKQEG